MSIQNTRIYQKTRVINNTDATLLGDASLIVDGGVSIGLSAIVGTGAAGLVLESANVGTIRRAGIIDIVSSTAGVTVDSATAGGFTVAAGDLTMTATSGDIVLDSTNVLFGSNAQFVTASNTLESTTGALNIVSAANIVLNPGVGAFLKAGANHIPTANDDLVTKGYVDSLASGLDIHPSCRVIAHMLPAYTAAGTKVGKTITGSSFGILTVDGVNTVLGDRIIVNLQPNNLDNGIYRVTTEGTAGTAFILTRATDADTNAEFTTGAFAFIEEGTTYGGSGFVCTTLNIDVDVSPPLVFVQFSSAGILVLSQIGVGTDVFNDAGNLKEFYRLAAVVNNATANANALVLANIANVNTFTLDMSRFVGPLTIANNSGDVSINASSEIVLFGTNGLKFETSGATNVITTTNVAEPLRITAGNNLLTIGESATSTLLINTSSGVVSTITSSADLTITNSANQINIQPGNFITRFGALPNSFTINSNTGSIIRTNGQFTIANTGSLGVTITPFNNVTTFGTSNTVTIDTGSAPIIGGSTSLRLRSTGANNIIVESGSTITQFGIVTPVLIDSDGQITRAATLDINTTAGNLTLTPSTNVTVLGTTSNVTVNTAVTPIIEGSTSLTLDTAGGDVNVTPSTGITNFGTSNPVVIDSATGTITRDAALTISTTTAGGIDLEPVNDLVTIGVATTATFNTSVSPTLTGSSSMTIASTGANNVIMAPANFVTQFGLATPVTINDSTGTISRGGVLTVATTGSNAVAINPSNNTTTFNSSLTVNSGTNPTVTANSGNLSLVTSAGTATISTNGTNHTLITSGSSTIASDSTTTGTLRIAGPAAATGGLAVDGTAFITTSVNAPVFANGATSSNTVTIRANTAGVTGTIDLRTTKVSYGNGSTVNKYIGEFSKAVAYTGGPGTVTLFSIVLPANLNAYLLIECVVDDGADTYIYSAKVLLRTSGGNVVTKLDLFEAITDPKFTYDLGTANTAVLRYTQTNATSNANMSVKYYTTGSATTDITSFT